MRWKSRSAPPGWCASRTDAGGHGGKHHNRHRLTHGFGVRFYFFIQVNVELGSSNHSLGKTSHFRLRSQIRMGRFKKVSLLRHGVLLADISHLAPGITRQQGDRGSGRIGSQAVDLFDSLRGPGMSGQVPQALGKVGFSFFKLRKKTGHPFRVDPGRLHHLSAPRGRLPPHHSGCNSAPRTSGKFK